MFSGFMIECLYDFVVPLPSPMVEYNQQKRR